MRKSVISTLFILSFLFGLVSCSNQLKAKTNVTMNFDVQQLYETLSARTAQNVSDFVFDEEKDTVRIEVTLFVNDKEYEKKQNTITKQSADKLRNDSIQFVFKSITLDSKVYAKAKITITNSKDNKTYTILEGQSETATLDSDSMELSVKLKWTDDLPRAATIDDIHEVILKYEIFKQKQTVTNPSSTEDYELVKSFSIPIKINFTNSDQHMVFEQMYSTFGYQMTELQMDMEIQGYSVNDTLSEKDPEFAPDTTEIICKQYWDKTDEPINPITMSGIDGIGNTYSLEIYHMDESLNYYKIIDNLNNKIAFGNMIAAGSNGLYLLYFTQIFYYKEGIPYNAMSDNPYQSIPVGIQYVSNSEPFIINCIKDSIDNTIPITFTYPSNFSIYSLVPYDGDDLPVIGQIIIAGTPKVSINKVDATEPLCLNSGEQQFTVTKLDSSVQITQLSAKLYNQGKEVQADTYLVQSNSQNLVTISPKFLSNCGTYIAKVIVKGSYGGKEFEACSNYILQVENQVIATLDVSQDNFMQSLIEVMSKASGPVKLTLTGERNFNPTNYYSPDYSLYQNIGYVLHQYNNPVELDMSGVSGNGTRVLETEIFSGLNSKITLATNLKAIHCAADTIFDLSQAGSSISSGTWYRLEVDKSWDDTMPGILTIKEVLAGNKTINEVYDNFMDISNQESYFNFSLSNWTEVVDTLSGNAQTYNSCTYYFIKGEN